MLIYFLLKWVHFTLFQPYSHLLIVERGAFSDNEWEHKSTRYLLGLYANTAACRHRTTSDPSSQELFHREEARLIIDLVLVSVGLLFVGLCVYVQSSTRQVPYLIISVQIDAIVTSTFILLYSYILFSIKLFNWLSKCSKLILVLNVSLSKFFRLNLLSFSTLGFKILLPYNNTQLFPYSTSCYSRTKFSMKQSFNLNKVLLRKSWDFGCLVYSYSYARIYNRILYTSTIVSSTL